MSALLDSIREGLELVVDKTEEYSKIGKLKVDIFGIKRNIEKQFVELGGRVFELMTAATPTDINADEECRKIVETVKSLETQLQEKEVEIAKVKADKEKERRERQEARKHEAEAKQDLMPEISEEIDAPEEKKSKKK